MSIWSDMEDRSAGISLSKEDYNLLYGSGVPKLHKIHEDTYKNMRYEISARKFPYIEIISKLYISIFSGSKQVILKDDKKTYELQRECMDNSTRFFYECNKEGDYIPDVQDGHLYSLDELKSLAEKLIDLILKAESNLFNEAD